MPPLVSSLFTPLLTIILPIFGLIFAGFAAARLRKLGPSASSELNRFVVYLALPALLFDIMAKTPWRMLDQPAFIAVFGIGSGVVFAATALVRLRQSRHLADASIDGLNAAYPNTGFIGLPLCLLAFGQPSLAPAVIATIMTVCVLFAVAIVMIELGLQTERHIGATLGRVAKSLATNPLLVAPLAGALWSGAGMHVSGGAEAFLKLLGGAASPCALVALGLFLGEKAGVGHAKTASALVALKLVAQPLLTWWLAFHVFALPPLWAKTAVILSALPTGTGPFMLAEFYRREAAVTSSAILFSTLVSLVTVTLCLAAML
ncbi:MULTISPECIES: AEC family transporter [unclassified Caballeronia]|uniref:AEC family transporter n=1 Tax=unclassified Caballeronia TaxID=2646786 RepID=UPI002857C3EC|nr:MULTISPECIES: AEC family transporter [unclassified Caballeronia]MDR5754573.1 AEC family transporter [Caballeronia sp. LZ024]MDR5839544.1 AEC family transporter [Caballeronia sp. LZ031]